MSSTQKISLTSAILMNINLMVGASAFMSPAYMTAYAGYGSFYGWLFAGALFFPVVWCIAQITTYFPGQGSFYSYSSNTISRSAGFISGWVYFLGYVSIGALQLTCLIKILNNVLGLSFIMNMPALFGTLLVTALGALSARSLGIVDRIQSWATIYKLVPLLIGVLSLLFFFSPAPIPSIFQSSPLLLIPTIPMAIFGFWGFEGVCSISHLIENSKRNASRAIFIGFGLTILIYTLFHLSLLSVMGATALTQEGAFGFVTYFGLSSAPLILALNAIVMSAIIVALINAIFGGIVANSAMLCAMAEEKLLFLSPFFARRLTETGRPLGAIIAHCAGVALCILLIRGDYILAAMSNLGVLIAFFLTIVALFLKTRGQWHQTIACLLGWASCALLSYYSWLGIGDTTGQRLLSLLPMVIIIVAGYLMYHYTARAPRQATKAAPATKRMTPARRRTK